MAVLEDYHGLEVVFPVPTGEGGLAIQDNFKHLVDWSPKSVWAQGSDPVATNDIDEGYYPGSMWLRTFTPPTPPRLFVCQSNANNAAVWNQVLLKLVQDTAPQLGADLDVNGMKLVSASNGNMVLQPNGTGKLVLHPTATGNVGVGTGTDTLKSLFTVNGTVATKVTLLGNNDYNAANNSDSIFICDPTTNNITITIPLASDAPGRCYYIKKKNINARQVIIQPASGTIENAATRVLNTNYEAVTIVSDGVSGWWIV